MFKKITLLLLTITLVGIFSTLETSAVTGDTGAQTISAPAKVKTFKAQTKSDSIKLTWSKVSGAEGYIIRWSGNEKKGTITIKGASKTAYVHNKLVAGKKYTYSIAAYKMNDKKRIESANKTICSGFIPTIDLKAVATTANSTKLVWDMPKTYKAGTYTLYMKVDGNLKALGAGTKARMNTANTAMTASYNAERLTPCKTYYFYVLDTVTGAKSKTITVKTRVPNVTGFTAMSTYGGSVLRWDKVPGATGYAIEWTSAGKKGMIRINDGNVTSFIHNLYVDSDFSYIIKAVNTDYGSSISATAANRSVARIQTMIIRVYLKTARTLTSHSGGSVTVNFYKGARIDAIGYTNGKYIFRYKDRLYHVNRISTTGAAVEKSAFDKAYSGAEAESFVNRLGLASNTSYLIWANTYTQKEYIFKGSKGKWKLVNGPWTVATGAVTTPTSTGLTRIKFKEKYPRYTASYWSICSYFSIHGNIWGDLGRPRSNGCIRNTDDHALWIYNTCPIGTAVYVF